MSSKRSCLIRSAIIIRIRATDLSKTAYKRIIEAKAIREKLEGDNFHQQQCSNIPDILVDAI